MIGMGKSKRHKWVKFITFSQNVFIHLIDFHSNDFIKNSCNMCKFSLRLAAFDANHDFSALKQEYFYRLIDYTKVRFICFFLAIL